MDVNEKPLLLNGNCFDILNNIETSDNMIVVTDPPFNVGYHYNSYEDNKDEDVYINEICSIISRFPTILIHYPVDIYKFAIKLGLAPNSVVSWVYNSNTAKQHRDIAYFKVNPCFDSIGEYKNPNDKRVRKLIESGRKPRGYDWIYSDQIKNVSKEKTEHPCQMPVEVMTYILKTVPHDSIIIDPFMGSGTTGVAAMKLGLRFIGIELDNKYFNIASNRING